MTPLMTTSLMLKFMMMLLLMKNTHLGFLTLIYCLMVTTMTSLMAAISLNMIPLIMIHMSRIIFMINGLLIKLKSSHLRKPRLNVYNAISPILSSIIKFPSLEGSWEGEGTGGSLSCLYCDIAMFY